MASSPLPLLDAIEAREAKREATTEAQRSAAMRDYWQAIDVIVGGDSSGGSDVTSFARTLADAGVTTAQARADVEAILACRAAVAERDRLRVAQQEARAEAEAAEDRRRAAKTAHDEAERDAQRAGWRHADLGQLVSGADLVLRDELPPVAGELRSRGYAGELLPPPPPPAPPRRWKIVGELVDVRGRMLRRGSVIELSPEAVLPECDAKLVASDEPLVELRPGVNEPGGPVAAPHEGERPRIDRAPMFDPSPSGAAVERHVNPPNNVVTA